MSALACPPSAKRTLQQLMPSLGQVLPNFREQLARAVRLRHIGITSRRSRCLFFPIERAGGDGDDRNRSQRPIDLDLARDLVAILDRQLDADQDEIRPHARIRG